MADAVADFCAFYHGYHDISPARRKMQVKALRAFEASLDGPVLEAEAKRLESHLSDLRAGGLAASTVKQRLNAIRPFFGWAWRQQLITADRLLELKDVRAPRVGQGVPRPYNRKEIQRLWAELDESYPWAFDRVGLTREQAAERGTYYLRRFDRGQSRWSRVQPYAKRTQIEAVIALALFAGLRRDEVFRATVEAIDPENDYVVVAGARTTPGAESRDRPVPWTTSMMRDSIIAWLALREQLAPDHDAVWLSLHQNHRLKPMRHRQFEMLLRQLGTGWEFHRLRHTFATEQLRALTPLENVKEMMGHQRLEQTLRYAQLIEMDLVHAASRSAQKFTGALMPRKAA